VTSVDLLRGAVIVLMALDHTREFFHFPVDPTDLARTTVPLFATRWVTHFCAPVFMALAGVGAYLNGSSGKTRAQLSRFLITRGLFLVVLEITVVRLGWFFNLDYTLVELLVIAALGWSMVVLAGLIWLPRRVLAAICLAVIAGHHVLDGIQPAGRLGWVWRLLHAPGQVVPAPGYVISIGYVLIPWMFVMALGYCCGPVFRWPPARRRRALIWAGALATLAFAVIRAINGYGDPNPRLEDETPARLAMSFLNTTKYPPSLLYLLMTLGPALVALTVLRRAKGPVADIFVTFGRVPFLFYVAHLYLVHALAVAAGVAQGFPDSAIRTLYRFLPEGYGFGLPVVYVVWLWVVAALYPMCRRYAAFKAQSRGWWVSYL